MTDEFGNSYSFYSVAVLLAMLAVAAAFLIQKAGGAPELNKEAAGS